MAELKMINTPCLTKLTKQQQVPFSILRSTFLKFPQNWKLFYKCKSSFRWSRSRRSSSGSHVYSSLQAGGSFDAVNTSPPSHLFHSFLLNLTSCSLFSSPHPSFKEFLSPLLLPLLFYFLNPTCLVFSAPHLVLMSHSSARSLSLSPLFFSTHPSPPFLPENSTSSSSFKVSPHLLYAAHRVQTRQDQGREIMILPIFPCFKGKCVWKLLFIFHKCSLGTIILATLWNEYEKYIFGKLKFCSS